ncbi:hypothetical protein BGX26_006272 [Mortierella sp. AD094]|nr:hypothetical protein BGX26_006272 [Mortierella sp. AD094]
MSLPRSTSLAPLLMMQHDRFKSNRNHNHKDIHNYLVHEDPQSANVRVRLDVGESEETNKDSRNEGESDSLEDEQRANVHSWQEFEVNIEYDAESEAESGQEESPSALASESELPVLNPTPEATRDRSLPSSTSLVPLLLMRRQHSKSNRRHADGLSRQRHSHSLKDHHMQRDLSPVSAQERLSVSASEGNEGNEREDEEQSEENSGHEYESEEEYDAESEAEPEQQELQSVIALGPAPSTASTKQSAGSDSEAHSLPSLREDDDDIDSTESDFNLAKLRQESLERLSQAWLEIFERYGKDVSELPPDDEIDLATGELIVDNGVLRSRSKAVFGTLTKLGHDLKKPLAEERERLKNMLEVEAHEGSESDISDEYRYNEEEQWSSSEYDSGDHSKQVSENESEYQSTQSSLPPSSTSSVEEERDDLGTIWKGAADEGPEPDSRSEVSGSEASRSEASRSEASESEASKSDASGDEDHSHDDRFYQFRDPQSLQEDEPWSSSECDSGNHLEQGYEEESEFPSSQASLSRSSASFEAASHFYRAEWRRAQMMPRARALADALLFKQPLTTAVVPSSPYKRSFGSMVPSSPLSSTSSAQTFGSSVMPLSFSVKRRRPNDVDYDLSLMPELDEDYV